MSSLRIHPLGWGTALLLGLGLGACVNAYPQRLPGPLVIPESAEPPEPPPLSGATPVTVHRSSSPVWIRRPGERGAYSLPFYRKRERLPVGTLVRTGAGGRAEVFWSPDASAIALFDQGSVTVGDPERDAPLVRFHSLTRALLVLTPEDRVELLGGAELRGDPLEITGTLLLERPGPSIVRLTNQSKFLISVAYREERLEVSPGESIDLPILTTTSEPRPLDEALEPMDLAGTQGTVRGRVESLSEGAAMRMTALEASTIQALGLEVRLEEEETVRFSGLSQVATPAPVDSIAHP